MVPRFGQPHTRRCFFVVTVAPIRYCWIHRNDIECLGFTTAWKYVRFYGQSCGIYRYLTDLCQLNSSVSDTDGGRIAVSMFGRRGILLVRTLVAAILCGAGLVGLDDSGILLNYVIVVLLWQNEIETPARNEVEELDFGRGCFGIGMAALVLTILLPLQS